MKLAALLSSHFSVDEKGDFCPAPDTVQKASERKLCRQGHQSRKGFNDRMAEGFRQGIAVPVGTRCRGGFSSAGEDHPVRLVMPALGFNIETRLLFLNREHPLLAFELDLPPPDFLKQGIHNGLGLIGIGIDEPSIPLLHKKACVFKKMKRIFRLECFQNAVGSLRGVRKIEICVLDVPVCEIAAAVSGDADLFPRFFHGFQKRYRRSGIRR